MEEEGRWEVGEGRARKSTIIQYLHVDIQIELSITHLCTCTWITTETFQITKHSTLEPLSRGHYVRKCIYMYMYMHIIIIHEAANDTTDACVVMYASFRLEPSTAFNPANTAWLQDELYVHVLHEGQTTIKVTKKHMYMYYMKDRLL